MYFKPKVLFIKVMFFMVTKEFNLDLDIMARKSTDIARFLQYL